MSGVTLVPRQIELLSAENQDTPNQKKQEQTPRVRETPSSLFFMSVNSRILKSSPMALMIKVNLVVSAATMSVSNLASQSQSRLILHVTGSGGGGGLALLVEFQEAGFLYHHGNGRFVAAGIFQRRQGAFLRSFG